MYRNQIYKWTSSLNSDSIVVQSSARSVGSTRSWSENGLQTNAGTIQGYEFGTVHIDEGKVNPLGRASTHCEEADGAWKTHILDDAYNRKYHVVMHQQLRREDQECAEATSVALKPKFSEMFINSAQPSLYYLLSLDCIINSSFMACR